MRPLPPMRRSLVLVALLTLAAGLPVGAAAAVPASDPRPAANVWSDVPDGYWAKNAIDLVASTNTWMQDYGPTTFQPDTVETRAYLARALVEAFASTVPPRSTITFADLPADDPFYPYADVAGKMHRM